VAVARRARDSGHADRQVPCRRARGNTRNARGGRARSRRDRLRLSRRGPSDPRGRDSGRKQRQGVIRLRANAGEQTPRFTALFMGGGGGGGWPVVVAVWG